MTTLNTRQIIRRWLAVSGGLMLLLWFALALHQRYGGSAFRQTVPWPEALGEAARNTLVWAALAGVTWSLSRRFPIDQHTWPRHGALHLLFAPGMLFACTALSVGVGTLFSDYLQIPIFRGPPPGINRSGQPATSGGFPGNEFQRPDWIANNGSDTGFDRRPPWNDRAVNNPGSPPPVPAPGRGVLPSDDNLPPWLKEMLGPEEPVSTGTNNTVAANPAAATQVNRSSGPPFGRLFRLTIARRGFQFLLGYLVILGFTHSWTYHRSAAERELRAGHLTAQLTEARLQTLQMQLNPHFLFNALHAISTLVHQDAKKANDMIIVLSDFLRMSLTEGRSGNHEAPLADELDFLKHYLAIEEIRFGERLKTEWCIADDTLDAYVPLFILQPLVENAFRHGIEQRAAAGRLSIRCARLDDRLALSVADDGVAMTAEKIARIKDGIGLANVRSRLRTFYGDTADFSLKPTGPFGLTVTLTVPYNLGPVLSSPLHGGPSTHPDDHR